MPNILKVFNPRLHGFSTGVKKTTISFNRRKNKRRRRPKYGRFDYNFAETGADSDDIIKQAYKLVRRMKRDPRVNWLSNTCFWHVRTHLLFVNYFL